MPRSVRGNSTAAQKVVALRVPCGLRGPSTARPHTPPPLTLLYSAAENVVGLGQRVLIQLNGGVGEVQCGAGA